MDKDMEMKWKLDSHSDHIVEAGVSKNVCPFLVPSWKPVSLGFRVWGLGLNIEGHFLFGTTSGQNFTTQRLL